MLPAPPGTLSQVRDLSVIDLPYDQLLVVACDSVGGIGPKEADTFAVGAAETAHFAARVPLLEILAAGARPSLVVDTLSVEMAPTGEEMIAAIREIAADCGLTQKEAVTGSTEDNVPVRATGIGVTVIATVNREDFRPGRSLAGDLVVCLGLPLSAPRDHIYIGHPGLIAMDEARTALSLPGVHDAVPVGSRGVGEELDDLVAPAMLGYELVDGLDLDLATSGGPASCLLVSCPPSALDGLRAIRRDLPVTPVARLVAS